MGLRARVSSIAVVVLALVAGLWLALRESTPQAVAPAPVVESHAPSREVPTELHPPAESPATRAAAVGPASSATATATRVVEQGLRVRSSSGLALPFVDVRVGGEGWRRVDLSEDGVPRQPLSAPCQIRGPGHVAAVLEPDVLELVLEPDMLFTVRAPELRGCVRAIDIEDPYLLVPRRGTDEDRRRREVAVWGFVSDSEWVVAASAEAVRRELSSDELRVELHRPDSRRSDALVRPISGLRATWEVQCLESVPGERLWVTVERPPDEESGPVEVRVGRYDVAWRDGRSEPQPWGRVIHYPDDRFHESGALDEQQDQLRFEYAPTGVSLVLVAQDLRSRAYGRTEFFHDGTAQSVVLLPPLVVTGRLVDARDGAPLRSASIAWQCRVAGERAFGWSAAALAAELPADGSFHLAGPQSPPGNPSMPLEPPGPVVLQIEAPGYTGIELERELDGARTLDIGELRLEPRTPELVLAPGHGLSPAQVAWHRFEVAGQPERSWEVRWGHLAGDGSLELHFGEPESPEKVQEPPDWSRAHALILYATDDAIPVRAFEREVDGHWAAVELRRRELQFRVEPSASSRNWWIGWEWNGLFGVCTGFSRPAAGETLEVVLHAPVEHARLAWASREPGQGGRLQPSDFVPLADALPALVLR